MKRTGNQLRHSPILQKYGTDINEFIKEYRKNNWSRSIDSIIIRKDIYDVMRKEYKKETGQDFPMPSCELKETGRGNGSVFGYNIELNYDKSADRFKIRIC